MRSTLGFVLAIVFVALLAVDPLVCADGCRDDGVEFASSAPACVICLGLGPVVGQFVFTPDESFFPAGAVAGTLHEQRVSRLIERPPKRT